MEMSRDDIIRMAKEAGYMPCQFTSISTLERFAELVAAAEREACAITLETEGGAWDGENFEIAGAIRARGKK